MIKGKKIVLTGATGGVGSEIAKMLYEAGARLILVSKNENKLKQLQESLTGDESSEIVKYLAVDFNNLEQVKKSVYEIIKIFNSSIDVLINNAGIGYHGKIETIDADELKEVFAVNTIAPIIITSKLLPFVSRSDAGHIINISSILGSRSMARTAAYAASKHALTGFTKVLRLEASRQGVRVTAIEPGAIDTAFILRTHESEAKEYFSKRKLTKIPPKVIADWIIKIIESDPMACPEMIQIMPQDQII